MNLNDDRLWQQAYQQNLDAIEAAQTPPEGDWRAVSAGRDTGREPFWLSLPWWERATLPPHDPYR